MEERMSFKDVLEILGIEKYEQRIMDSNSYGELFHLQQYVNLSKIVGKTDWFPIWFDGVVDSAEKSWRRPESVFQYIEKILLDHHYRVS